MSLDRRINITMLGGSGAGKTCYMVAMYKMMNFGINLNGFVLSAEDSDDNVLFGELWRDLSKQSGPDRWPAPTSGEASTYNLNFYFGNSPVLGFNWFDYRGGALEDYKGASDLKMLRERLQQTSCLLFCVSGEHLANGVKLSAFDKIAVSGINQLITDPKCFGDKNTPPAVVIVLTKSDLCKHRSREEIVNDIKQLFSPLFASGAEWLVMICPVTLGSSLASDESEGEIEPENVHIPVVFSLFAELFKQHWNLEDDYEENYADLRRTSENFLASLVRRSYIREKEQSVSELRLRLDHIRKNIERIYNKVEMKNEVDVFFNGKSIRFHEFFNN